MEEGPVPTIAADLQTLVAVERELGDVDAALRRIDAGSYGRCEACGRSIEDDRLAALPAVPECAACEVTRAEDLGGRPAI